MLPVSGVLYFLYLNCPFFDDVSPLAYAHALDFLQAHSQFPIQMLRKKAGAGHLIFARFKVPEFFVRLLNFW